VKDEPVSPVAESGATDFGPFDSRIWFNCAHQGPLPNVAVTALREALTWKIAPYRIKDEMFSSTPQRLKTLLGKLIGVPGDQIILGNSASYGLHILANGIRWKSGDEVLLVEGDFPASIFPWLNLRNNRGVLVRSIKPHRAVLQDWELEAAVTPATKLFCATWVDSFTGHVIDLSALGEICRAKNILFVVNASQGLGARELNVGKIKLDALTSCGYKWLCGPYGTGFCWIRPALRDSLSPCQSYWFPAVWGRNPGAMRDWVIPEGLGAAAYDVFCTANFFNFVPWGAAIEYWLSKGIPRIQSHNDALAQRLIGGLDPKKYTLFSPEAGSERSAIVVLSHSHSSLNHGIRAKLAEAGIDLSLRENNLRFSLHFFNTYQEVDYALAVLNAA